MLVSNIKPCMSKFTLFHGEKSKWLIKSVKISNMLRSYFDNRGNSRANISLPHLGKEAAAKLTQSRHGEIMTKKNNTGLFSRPLDRNQ